MIETVITSDSRKAHRLCKEGFRVVVVDAAGNELYVQQFLREITPSELREMTPSDD
jgi:hypothetical protein